ncbi:MAG TPA: hypothetical protein VEA58_13015 [Anaerovoracaceae bacterium]|nr:hypothetical protein [Anaerovoracaceae bacterium]
MNPALIVAAVLYLSQNQGKLPFKLPSPSAIGKLGIPAIKDPGYFDTFKMELLLDRLHSMTSTLEKVNHLNQMRSVPLNKTNSIDRVQESLDAVKGLLYTNKSSKHIDSLSDTLSNVKQLGDMQGLMTNMAPILSMLSNKNDK